MSSKPERTAQDYNLHKADKQGGLSPASLSDHDIHALNEMDHSNMGHLLRAMVFSPAAASLFPLYEGTHGFDKPNIAHHPLMQILGDKIGISHYRRGPQREAEQDEYGLNLPSNFKHKQSSFIGEESLPPWLFNYRSHVSDSGPGEKHTLIIPQHEDNTHLITQPELSRYDPNFSGHIPSIVEYALANLGKILGSVSNKGGRIHIHDPEKAVVPDVGRADVRDLNRDFVIAPYTGLNIPKGAMEKYKTGLSELALNALSQSNYPNMRRMLEHISSSAGKRNTDAIRALIARGGLIENDGTTGNTRPSAAMPDNRHVLAKYAAQLLSGAAARDMYHLAGTPYADRIMSKMFTPLTNAMQFEER